MKFYAISENYLYRNAFRNGMKRSSRSMAVYVLKDRQAYRLKKENPEKKLINRVGIQASKKIGGAVQRNRAKRVIREAYRLIDKKYKIKLGRLIVIIPFVPATKLKMQDVENDLFYCLKKLDMLAELPQTKDETVSSDTANAYAETKESSNGSDAENIVSDKEMNKDEAAE